MNYFVTFTDIKFADSRRRIVNQASSLNIFDVVIGYTEDDLKNTPFWTQHSSFILNNKRGFGYWVWKPYFILETLKEMNDGDILLYCDAGCEINNRESLTNLFEIVRQDRIVMSYSAGHNEISHCKMDLLVDLKISEEHYLTNQRQATSICFLKCDEIMDFVNEWYHLCCNYHYIDDSPSLINNDASFVENRHDQVIFSLLSKQYNLYSKEPIEKFVHLSRNRTGISKI